MSRLRCWPGCLAVIVLDECPDNLGAIVKVLKRANPHEYSSFDGEEWEVMPTRALRCWGADGYRLVQAAVGMRDIALRPITPPPGTETTDTEVPADAVAA